jgi:hypothetical protein
MQPPQDEMTYEEAIQNHPGLMLMFREGKAAQDMVPMLVKERERLIKEIMKLQAICPRKIAIEGTVYVWHCPSDLIPETK